MGRREDGHYELKLNPTRMTLLREQGHIDYQFPNRLMVTRNLIERLGLETELDGHSGCVNCLEWNSDGSVLASASDDLHVVLWDPHRQKSLHNMSTGHTGNIFSVKFMTRSIVATCAADSTVRVYEIGGGSAPMLLCSCHCGRVKRLASHPTNPQIIWSAGEDGLVLQHDLRQSHRCNTGNTNVLINLINHIGRYAEAKCVAVNPRRPEQLAIGANDFYVRLYDTRMICLSKLQSGNGSTGTTYTSGMSNRARLHYERNNATTPVDDSSNIPKAAVQYFAPGHMSTAPNDHAFPKKATTYLNFSHDGTELLANLGSEQIYVFDVNGGKRPVLLESFIIEHNYGNRSTEEVMEPKIGLNYSNIPPEAKLPLPAEIERLKRLGNEYANSYKYPIAVQLYSRAIGAWPWSAALYSNRAAALMRRGWAGDTYAAVRDCYKAIWLDSSHLKAHFRLARGLMDMKRAREAHECLVYFRERFPRHAASHAATLLQRDINLALEKMDTQSEQGDDESKNVSAMEQHFRNSAFDYTQRFLGHCNTTTDIKEANFLGPDANYIGAGSDDGCLFIWCRRSGCIVRCLKADDSILNCVQMHPSMCLIATSGIETVVRLWAPLAEDDSSGEGTTEGRTITDTTTAAIENQKRMRSDPFEAMLLNISFAGGAPGPDSQDLHSPVCRAS